MGRGPSGTPGRGRFWSRRDTSIPEGCKYHQHAHLSVWSDDSNKCPSARTPSTLKRVNTSVAVPAGCCTAAAGMTSSVVLMSALTLLHAGSAYSWYQADWDTNSGHLTGTFGEFGPGNFAVFVVAATTCLNAQLSVVSGSAPVFAYVMHQNDYDGWGSTTTYAGLTQGTPALPGTSCNVLAGETCDFAANSLDPSEGYVVLLANQNSGSTQASGSVTITSSKCHIAPCLWLPI